MTQSYFQRFQEEVNRQNRANQPYERSLQANDNQRAIDARNAGNDLLALSKFSTQLTNHLVENQKKQNKEDYLEYVNKGYEQGFDQQEIDSYQADVDELKADRENFETQAGQALKDGQPFEVADEISNLSGWKAYGLAVGQAKAAADGFGAYLTAGLQDSTASTLPEKRAELAKLRTRYIEERGFVGMNPMLLNEHLFPGLRKAETAKMNEILKQDRIDKSVEKREAAFLEFEGSNDIKTVILQLENTVDSQGRILGKKGAWDAIEQHVENRAETGSITVADLNEMKEGVPSHGGGKTFGELYANRFELWEETVVKEKYENEQDRKKLFTQEYVTALAKEEEELGRPFTNEEKLQKISEGDYANGPMPEALKKLVTEEQQDQNEAVKLLSYKLTNQLPIYKEDLKGIYDPNVYQRWDQLAQNSSANVPPKDLLAQAEESIKARIGKYLEETDANKDKSPKYVAIKHNADRLYKLEYAKAIQVEESPDQAHLTAIEKVEEAISLGKLDKRQSASTSQVHSRNLETANYAISQNPSIINTQIIPGTEQTLEQARSNPKEVPMLYKQIAAKHKNITPHQLMTYQLEAAGDKPIPNQIDEFVSTLDPVTQLLLKFHATNPRVRRAIIKGTYNDGELTYNEVEHLMPELLENVNTTIPEIKQDTQQPEYTTAIGR